MTTFGHVWGIKQHESNSTLILENAYIYTSTLILCNSLNYDLMDIKLGTSLNLSFYHSSELYGQNCLYQYCTALC